MGLRVYLPSLWLCGILLVTVPSCSTSRNGDAAATEADDGEGEAGSPGITTLQGTWQSASFTAEVTTPDDPTGHPSDKMGYEKMVGAKKAVWKLGPHHHYNCQYLDANGNELLTTQGRWTANGTLLTLHQRTPQVMTQTYQYSLAENALSIRGTVDWDGDAQSDDRYEGTFLKKK